MKKETIQVIEKSYGLKREDFFTVSEVSKVISGNLTKDPRLNKVHILGEISNLSKPSSGHIYFDLKDNESLIRCTFFKGENHRLKFELKDGLEVLILGSIRIYEKRSNYQVNISTVFPIGEGILAKKLVILGRMGLILMEVIMLRIICFSQLKMKMIVYMQKL